MAPSRLVTDVRGSFVSAVLPAFFAVSGLLVLAAGAIMNVLPLLVLGAGFVVIAAVVYLLAATLDRSDRQAAKAPKRSRADEARAAFEEDRRAGAPVVTRSPLADHAVAALTGSSSPGGIYPPIGATSGGARPAGSSASGATATGPGHVSMWEAGEVPAPGAFQDGRIVEFQEVAPRTQMVTAGGGSSAYGSHPGGEPQWDAPAEGAGSSERDFRIWPGSKDMDQWATFTGERKKQTSRVSDEDIRSAMAARRKEFAGKLPTVGAILAGVDARNDPATRDMTRGKCSQCENVIWAPKQRPILLKCPGCGHKARLY